MDDEMDVAYASKGIVVVPDYLANAGGVIIVTEGFEDAEWDDPGILEKLRGIKFTTENVLEVAQYERHTPMRKVSIHLHDADHPHESVLVRPHVR